MTFFFPSCIFILLLVLLGSLLGWLLYWLVDSAWQRRETSTVVCEAGHAHGGCTCDQECVTPDPKDCCCDDDSVAIPHFRAGNCESKRFVLKPLHGTSEIVQKTVDLSRVQPCFEVRWGDSPQDLIKTKDVEALCIVARNPYTNVRFVDLTIVEARVTREDGTPVPSVPDGTPSVELVPWQDVRLGDLGPMTSTASDSACESWCEITLTSKQAHGGDYLLQLWYDYRVRYVFHQTDVFSFPIG